jgi:pantoate--beta-alanine ligase
MAIQVLRDIDEVGRWSFAHRCEGRGVALIPTMGFLHEGHLSLMREGARRAEVAAASIFVNPAQFGPREDLARYPRDPEGDIARCESAGVKMVFMPRTEDIYPPGFNTWVNVSELSRGLCGDRRPDHFRGVATVVTKLLCMVRPHLAVFGEKDFQQLQVIRALCRDLNLGVEVVGMPTIREPDGLAMSSRNAYLSPEERSRALGLSRGLQRARTLAQGGIVDVRELVTAIRVELEASGVREDYVEVVDPDTLKPLSRVEPGRGARALVAGYLGPTRLIDNMALVE